MLIIKVLFCKGSRKYQKHQNDTTEDTLVGQLKKNSDSWSIFLDFVGKVSLVLGLANKRSAMKANPQNEFILTGILCPAISINETTERICCRLIFYHRYNSSLACKRSIIYSIRETEMKNITILIRLWTLNCVKV